MEYAQKYKESLVRSDKKNRPPKGEVAFVDNRSDFTSQAKFLETMQRSFENVSRYVVQRNPIGTSTVIGVGRSYDNDREGIRIEEMPEMLRVYQDEERRTRVGIAPHLDALEKDTNPLLKHYMVVKNGTSYQLPIKHLSMPKENTDGEGTTFTPNAGNEDRRRGGQPEGFGGNQDWDDELVQDNQINLAASRDATLRHEYQEEARRPTGLGDNARLASSKYFNAGWAVGTMSVVSTDRPLDVDGFRRSPEGDVERYGEAEMAGTITIDCEDLFGRLHLPEPGRNIAPTREWLENKIGEKIRDKRNDLLISLDQPIPRNTPFWYKAGILSHLVTMIAEDLIAEKRVPDRAARIAGLPLLTPPAE